LRTDLELARPVYKNAPESVLVYRNEGPEPAPDDDAAIRWAMGHSPEGWPEGLPLPLKAGEALAAFEQGIDALAKELERDIRHGAMRLVQPEMIPAVLLRRSVAERWPISGPNDTTPPTIAAALQARAALGLARAGAPRKPRPGIDTEVHLSEWFQGWPGEAAPAAVAEWAREPLNSIRPGMGDELADSSRITPRVVGLLLVDEDNHGQRRNIPAGGIALLYLAETDVLKERQRPAVRIDAGPEHNYLLRGLTAGPTAGDGLRYQPDEDRLFLRLPGSDSVQLALPGVDTLQSPFVDGLKRLVGPEGLRHWAAFHEALSAQGSTGAMRWTLDSHLERMGYSAGRRTRAATRQKAADLAKLFTKVQLEVVHPGYGGRPSVKERRPLLLTLGEYQTEAPSDDAWVTEALELEVNPTIYGGVRNSSTGRLGVNHGLVPYGLAALSHSRDAAALVLGINLGIRFRLAANEGKGWLKYKGSSWLNAAAISFSKHDPGRAWGALERALDRLQKVHAIASWQWEDHPRTLGGNLRADAAPWIQDRLLAGVAPEERRPLQISTGAELREHRKALGLSQAAMAAALGVSRATVARAEGDAGGKLPRSILKGLTAVRA